MQNSKSRIKILDIPIDTVNMDEALKKFSKLISTDGCDLIVTPNSEIVMNAQKDSELRMLIEKAALVIPDGIGLVYASKIVGAPLSERVTGIDFLGRALAHLQHTGQSVYLLGSKPASAESESIAALAARNMKAMYPQLIIAGTHDGYFSQEQEKELVDEINKSGAEFLVVALGAPKQEKFIYKYRKQFVNVKAGIGVGGSLDVWAGAVKRAPEFYQKHGLEWLYRFAKEPTRIRRVMQLPLFMIKVLLRGKK
ncbi:MAG: WecB/TagA/CpsF family glycosyltransferase [Eubacteriales bacterium]